MTWEEFLDETVALTKQVRTNILCPKCKRPIYMDETMILTSYPAKHRYWCSCGWVGYAPTRWTGEVEE